MHPAKRSDSAPRLWKRSSTPFRINRFTRFALPCVLASAFVSIEYNVAAQTPRIPALRVARNYQLGQRLWPVDLNRDGITDLVSSSSNSGRVQVSIGRGDGTFKAPVESSVQGTVMTTGDFNGDQRPDVVVSRATAQGTSFVILPGTGTATLGAGVEVVSAPVEFAFALSADLDGDGDRDLVLSSPTGAAIYPGRGDFTFGAPIQLVTPGAPLDGIVADIDNDGRKDLVTANGEGGTVSVFMNHGAFIFSPSDLQLTHQINDVTVGDLDHDGRLELLVAAGRPDSDSGFGEGFVVVFHGNGNGAFAGPTEYPVATGPMQIVAGDFNRDGVLDVVTGNRSPIARDDCSTMFKTWDSVSILAGMPNGMFAAARSFSIGDQSLMDPANPQTDRYRSTLTSLNTSDVNGDGATDLIASEGAILFNIIAVPNRPPTVNAGPDTVLLNTHDIILRPAAADPDEDMLSYEIRDGDGHLISTYPNACFDSLLHDGDNAFSVTVRDGHGHSASDTVVYTVVTTDGVGRLATGQDIGRVGAEGGESYDGDTDTYTVRGSGADIWGTGDEFHYVWTQQSGDFEVMARVDSVQNVNAWTKAGLMIRGNLHPGSVHASLFATPGKGVAFQRRTSQNGVSVHSDGPGTTAPVWLKLQRTGSTIAAYWRKTATDNWIMVGQETLSGLPSDPLVGLAVSSHADGKVASASFSQVVVQN
jgi:hypothetical protein